MFGGFGSIPHKPNVGPVKAQGTPQGAQQGTPQGAPQGAPSIHNPTPSTLGALRQASAPSGGHNPTPATLGAVPQSNAPGRPHHPAGPAPAASGISNGPAQMPIHNPTPSTLGAVPPSPIPGAAGQRHAQGNPGGRPGSKQGSTEAANVPNHVATPATLGTVPNNVSASVGMHPLYNPTPPTLGAVPNHAPPSPRHGVMGPMIGIAPNAINQTYSRYVGPAPTLAKVDRRNRPPLVNYAPGQLKLSILIPTLLNRAAMLGPLLQKLEHQIKELGPVPEVEVVIYEDNKENPVGFKRNKLLMEAKGDFVVYVDDDDELSDDYVFQIYTAILDHPKVDCIGMRGMITVNGADPRQVIYSVHNQGIYDREGIYYRPAGHLTPIRRSIAQRYRFPDKNFGEDSEWAMAMVRDKAIKNEFFIDKVLYHYKFSHRTSETAGTRAPGQKPVAPTYSVVILSAMAPNLRQCLAWLFEKEPMLPRNRIIVVDDGAQAEWQGQGPGVRWVKGVKPFVFARNANIGIREAGTDVVLLNDDAKLMTKYGFTSLSFATRSRPDVGICSAAISGVVGNPSQQPWLVAAGMRYEPHNLAFVAAYIPKSTFDRIGPLDERFTGYGYEDNDYCARAKKAGLGLSIYDGCVVEHSTAGNSTFRTKPNIQEIMEHNRKLFVQKWGGI